MRLVIILSFLTYIYLTSSFGIERNYFCHFDCGKSHTACKYAPCFLSNKHCGREGKYLPLEERERELMTQRINILRHRTAENLFSFGQKEGATKMFTLSYDLEVEFVAQCWANQCTLQNDICNSVLDAKTLGQNFYYFNYAPDPHNPVYLLRAVASWVDEHHNLRPEVIKKFVHSSSYANFTQLIWGKTYLFGCGRASNSEKGLYIFCNFAPAGNRLGEPVFVEGKSCSDCEGYECNTKLPGLCGYDFMNMLWEPPFFIDAAENLYSYAIIMFIAFLVLIVV